MKGTKTCLLIGRVGGVGEFVGLLIHLVLVQRVSRRRGLRTAVCGVKLCRLAVSGIRSVQVVLYR